MKQYTQTDVELLLGEVESNFKAYLAKAEQEEPEEKKEPKKEEKEDEAKESDEHKELKHDEKAPLEHEKEKSEPKDEPAKEAGDDMDCDYDDEDHAHVQKMYGSMKKGELKVHHDAIKGCLDKHCMAKDEGDDQMMMSEMKKSESFNLDIKKFSHEVALLKSEISAEKAKNDQLKKEMALVEKFVEKLVANKPAPAAKAFTSLDVIQKSEVTKEEKTLTKSEITQVLARKAQDPSLSKSDRDLINQYCLTGGSTQIISHLLK